MGKADTIRGHATLGSVTVKDTPTPKLSNPAKPFGTVTVKGDMDMGDGRITQGAKPTPASVDSAMRATTEKSEAEMDKCEYFSLFKNGQWSLNKAAAVDPKAPKAAVDQADQADPTDPTNPDPAAATLAKDPADPVAPAAAPAAPAPAAAAAAPAPKDAGAGSGSGNSPTKTNTETGGSSPSGASTGGVGSGIGGAGTGGAATGGASTGGAGTVTVTISGSSSTETSSGAGAKKGKGKGGEPAAPITLNISNVGGRTDAGNVASGDGPGAAGEGGSGRGSGAGGGGAAPDEPKNFSTSGKDPVVKFDNNGQWKLK